MDHVHQPIPDYGPQDVALLEAYTTLAALATQTSTIRLGTLVTPVTFRSPALLAKMVTTIDIISHGRAIMAIGSGWHEPEHHAYGLGFPPLKIRSQQLAEAIAIIKAMFRDERPVLKGEHFSVDQPINSPRPLQPGGPPLLIGGSGEKRTFPLMAAHADLANLTASVEDTPAKVAALHQACDAAGRDPATLPISTNLSLVIAETREEAEDVRARFFAARGLIWNELDAELRAILDQRLPAGDAEVMQERLGPLFEAGLTGLTVNLPAQFHEPSAVATAGRILNVIVPAGRRT